MTYIQNSFSYKDSYKKKMIQIGSEINAQEIL